MGIFTKKKKEPPKKLEVRCKCQKEKMEVDYSSVEGMPVGYRGRYSFYVDCPHCKKRIYINETDLSEEYLNSFYKRNV